MPLAFEQVSNRPGLEEIDDMSESVRCLQILEAAQDIEDQREIDKAQQDLAAYHQQYKLALATVSSLQAVLQAVDPYKVADIFGGVWVGISGCIAAAVAPSTQVFTFGMNMGEKIASVCNAALENALQRAGVAAVTDDVRKWQTFSVDLACHTVAVTSTFYAQVHPFHAR